MTMAPRASFDIRLKRAYEPAAAADGTRILVDRLWPHGVMKEKAAIDRWAREIAPSAELRRWFGMTPAAGATSGAGMPPNFRARARRWTRSRHSHGSGGSRWFSARAMRSIIMPSCSETCC